MIERKYPWVCPACRGTMLIGTKGNWHCCSCKGKTESTKEEIVWYFNQEMEALKIGHKLEIKKLMESKASDQKQEEPTMKVSYKGHTGYLIRLELVKNYRTTEPLYDLVIARDGYDDPPSIFIGIKLEEIKFLGGSVSFE